MRRDDDGIPAGWEDILEPGERVLWQGQPDPSPDLSALRPAKVLFGLVFVAAALFWITEASRADGLAGLILPLFGLIFVLVGLRAAGGEILWDAYRRRRTWYSLTNRRAFIATDLMGRRRLDPYPIGPQTPLSHENGRDVFFAMDFVRTKTGSRRRRIGFTDLADSAAVYDIMRKVQREAT